MGIKYVEKGAGLHSAIVMAGHRLTELDGVWVSSDDRAVQSIINTYPLSALHAELVATIDAHANTLRDHLVAKTSSGELAAWPRKREEARAYSSLGKNTTAPLLGFEAATRGITLDDLVSRVQRKADTLAKLEAEITGVAGKHKDAVRGTKTFEKALAYDWLTEWPSVSRGA